MHATRRRSSRRQFSARVRFLVGDREVTGWTLNVSVGGIRAIIVDDPVQLGAEIDVVIGAGPRRPGRIVWMQDEPDGSIVGVSFLDGPDSERPATVE